MYAASTSYKKLHSILQGPCAEVKNSSRKCDLYRTAVFENIPEDIAFQQQNDRRVPGEKL